MRAVKLTTIALGLFVAAQYAQVYYNSTEFNSFVQYEVERARFKDHLKETLVAKAKTQSLPVSEDDITVTTHGSVFKIAVDYKVPVNLFAFSPELSFHVTASGLLR